MRRLLLATLLAANCQVQAQATSGMDALLRDITQSSQASGKLNAEREARFLRNKNEQAALLAPLEVAPRVGLCRTYMWDIAQSETRECVAKVAEKLEAVGNIAVVRLKDRDIVRHPLVAEMLGVL